MGKGSSTEASCQLCPFISLVSVGNGDRESDNEFMVYCYIKVG